MQQQDLAELREEMNFTLAMANLVSPVPLPTPRYPPRPPVFQNFQQNAPMNLFNIDRSVIASLNMGTIGNLAVNIQNVHQGGNEQLADQLRDFTQAVLDERALTKETKEELLEQLEVVSAAAREPAAAKKSVLKAIFAAIAGTAATLENLASAWAKLEPYLRRLLD